MPDSQSFSAPKSPDSDRQLGGLERFLLHETRNPYVANVLTAIAISQDSRISLEEAITLVREQGHKGVLALLNYINFFMYLGGGGLRGIFYDGQQIAFEKVGITAKFHYGVSIGGVVAPIYGLRYLQSRDGPQATKGIDISPDAFHEVTMKLALSMHESGLVSYLPRKIQPSVQNVNRYRRGFLGESFILKGPLVEVFKGFYGNLQVPDLQGTVGIPVCDLRDGRVIVAGVDEEYNDRYVWSVLEEAISFPMVFELARRGRTINADGGLRSPPFRKLLQRGADLIYCTLLNFYVPKVEKLDGRGLFGKVRLFNRVFELMQNDLTSAEIQLVTDLDPIQLSEGADPNGRVLLSLDDLSAYDSFEFDFKGYTHIDLIRRGSSVTKRVLNKLDPSFKYEGYNPQVFLQRVARRL